MKYFIPKLDLAENHKSKSIFKEKLGGVPFGLADKKYPFCKQCGSPMSFIAQFEHHSKRLDLGLENRILFVFQCSDDEICETWDADSGANFCFIEEPEDMVNQFTKLPKQDFYVAKEKIVTGWNLLEDDIPESSYDNYFDVDYYYDREKSITLNQGFWDKVPTGTKLGGVPHWIQSPDECPKRNWKFVGQLDSAQTDNDFGDMGIAYIFIEILKDSSQLPKCKFLWQCG